MQGLPLDTHRYPHGYWPHGTSPAMRPVGPSKWRLEEPLTFVLPNGYEHTVPRGSETDLISIPWLARPWFRNDGPALAAAIVHDDGYKRGLGASRRYWDLVFYHGMLAPDVTKPGIEPLVPVWQANLFYAGVRVGGWKPWRKWRRAEERAMKLAPQKPVVDPTLKGVCWTDHRPEPGERRKLTR